MFSLIKQDFIVLLSFSSSLGRVAIVRTKCLSLNDEPCMVRPTLIDLNPVELKYDSLIISLDKCNGSCNVLSPKICALKETKDINVKVFNMLTNKNEITNVIANANSIVQYVIQIKNRIMKHVIENAKSIQKVLVILH